LQNNSDRRYSFDKTENSANSESSCDSAQNADKVLIKGQLDRHHYHNKPRQYNHRKIKVVPRLSKVVLPVGYDLKDRLESKNGAEHIVDDF
jgi:hypothetical protein